MKKSRIEKSSKTAAHGIIYQIIVLSFSFIGRTIFVKTLGSEYLGINGLFSNILTVLALAELGFGTAINYSLYRPIAEHNTKAITALMNFYKKVYNIIAVGVLGIGLSLIPFLDMIVNLQQDIPHLKIYYVLVLLQTVISYCFAYKMAILNANQQGYMVSNYGMVTYILQFVLQSAFLILTHNFIIYLCIQILCTFVNNLLIAHKVDKVYPELKGKDTLSKQERKSIFTNVKALFVYKVGSVILNGTDNILISTLVGTIWVGIYSNYILLINSIRGFVVIIFNSIQASIGNLSVSEDNEKQYFMFKVLNLLCFLIYGFCSICFLVLFDDFMMIWLGKDFLLGQLTLAIVVLNFFIPGSLSITSLFRDSVGLFKKTKYVFLVTALLNLVLSIVFAQFWGLNGILFATLVARLLTNFWYEPYVLLKQYFHKSAKGYFIQAAGQLVVIFVLAVAIKMLLSFLPCTIIWFFVKCLLCAGIVLTVFWLGARKTAEYKYLYDNLFRRFIKKK